MEVLAQKMRQNQKIKGVLDGQDDTLAQFANDLWTLIKASQTGFEELIFEFDQFSKNTGLKINYDKTQIMRVGSLRYTNAKYYSDKPIHWSEGIKILGFWIYADTVKTTEYNHNQMINKFKGTLNIWQVRSLSLVGRILLINTLATPLLIQKLTCLPISESFHSKIQNIIDKFLWNGKRPKIPYSKLTKDIQDSGLKLVDTANKEIALKISWVKKSLDTQKFTWKNFLAKLLPLPIQSLWESNINCKDWVKLQFQKISPIWNSVIIAWCKYSFYEPTENHKF